MNPTPKAYIQWGGMVIALVAAALWIIQTASVCPPERLTVKAWQGATAQTDSLQAFVRRHQGKWIDENSLEYHPETPDFWIELDTAWLEPGRAKVKISEYCRPDIVDFIYFVYKEGKLVYEGAEYQGCYLNLDRIDVMTVEEKVISGRNALLYEAKEVEYANETSVTLFQLTPVP